MSDALRCDDCGRFIPLNDLVSGKALRVLETPDSEVSKEIYRTLCAWHAEGERQYKTYKDWKLRSRK